MMKLLVVGGGAVGCYFGARLHRAGHGVRLLARGSRREALAAHGVTLETERGREHVPVPVADRAEDWDAILLCVKAWQVEDALAGLPPPDRWGGVIVTLQNGVEAPDQSASKVGAERVVAGIVHGFFEMAGIVSVRHVGVPPRIRLGAIAPGGDRSAAALSTTIAGAGIASDLPPDIRAALWEKLLLGTAVGAVGAVARSPIGPIRDDPRLHAMLEQAMREIEAVARANGIALPGDVVPRALAFVAGFPPDATTSMQRDLMTGRRSELDAQLGAVMRFARAGSVEAPVCDGLHAILSLQAERAGQVIGEAT